MAHLLTKASSSRLTIPSRRASALPFESSSSMRWFDKRTILGAGVGGMLFPFGKRAKASESREGEIKFTEKEWRDRLTPEQYYVLRQAGTERPRTSPLDKEKRKGTFVCAGCGTELFSSSTKFNSGTGWPSFFQAIDGAVMEEQDNSMFMSRTEVRCRKCQGHLGHVFDDGPRPTGLRYCMNGAALVFVPETNTTA